MLKEEIQNSILFTRKTTNLNRVVYEYNDVLSNPLDKHAPLVSKDTVVRPKKPWYTEDINSAKQWRRAAERKWLKTGLAVHLKIFHEECARVKQLCHAAKVNFFQSKITENASNQKELFKITNDLLHRKKESKLPTFKSAQELANRFADYFSNKIEKIIQSFDTSTTTQDSTCSNYTGTCFNNFSPISEDQLKKIILGGNSKWCHLDPVPTEVLKQVIDCIIPTLTTIVNISLQTCTFPQHLKSATVVPLLKKSTLDAEEEKNYRPVSNLAYVSKLIERVAVDKLQKHMDANNLHESCQSAYRKGHSTETALLKINNDLLCAMDNSQCVLLVMLDLSAAFDTVSHSTLLSRMDKLYGVRGDALL